MGTGFEHDSLGIQLGPIMDFFLNPWRLASAGVYWLTLVTRPQGIAGAFIFKDSSEF
jgi:hypothetical protein